MKRATLEVQELMDEWERLQVKRSGQFNRDLQISLVALFILIGVTVVLAFSIGITQDGIFGLGIAYTVVVGFLCYSQGAITALNRAGRQFSATKAAVSRIVEQSVDS